MLNRVCTAVFTFALFASPAAYAQVANGVRNITPGPSHTKAITVIDRPEIKIQRVEIEPNATRGLHAHDDVIYHVFMTMDAPLVLKIEGEPDVHLDAWQTHFFNGGTVHSITNTSGEPVRFLEVFVNKPAAGKTAAIDPVEAEALARAFAK